MNKVLLSAIWTLTAIAGEAQTQPKTAPQTAASRKSETASNEETNLRAYIELLRTDVRKSKAEIMAEVMQLDAGETAKFWPVYKDFEAEYATLGDRIANLAKEYVAQYAGISDAVADKLATQVLSIEDDRNTLKKKFYARMKDALGAVTAARFLQVENQLERLMDLQISASLPIGGER
jgi:hypothetical protein